MVGRAGVAPANGPHHDSLARFPLQAPRQAAAARAELLRWRLLEARVLQDAFWEGGPQAALTAAARQAFACKQANKQDFSFLNEDVLPNPHICRRQTCDG